MKYKHLIISRVALKWYDKAGETLRCESELNMTWDEWLANSIKLYSTYTRKSLAAQTNQNFTLISIVDESVEELGELLPNEVVLRVSSIANFINETENFIRKEFPSDLYLLSRIDRDDCFAINYVHILQSLVRQYLYNAESPESRYFDITQLNMYDATNNVFATRQYSKNATSPFTSVLTDFPRPALYGGHGRIIQTTKGIKSDLLNVLQIIHEDNLANRVNGKILSKPEGLRKLLDYGIPKNPGFSIDDNLHRWILKNIPKGSTILELGSGYGTIGLAKNYNMISIENDKDWLDLADSKYIYAPIVGKWYDANVLRKELANLEYDVILIDGPWIGLGNRYGFIDNIDLFKETVTVIFDDTHREDEKFMCEYFSKRVGRPYEEYVGKTKNFSVIKK